MNRFIRPLLISFLTILSLTAWADKLYWVDGSGNFNDANHWSLQSGGQGGAKSPTASDDVYFDENSFSGKSIINFIGQTEVHDIAFSQYTQKVIFSGLQNEKIIIHGSLRLNAYIDNQFLGDIHFVSSQFSTSIFFSLVTCKGNVYFNGNTIWNLQGNIITDDNSSVYLKQGTLNVTNGGIYSGNMIFSSGVVVNSNKSTFKVKDKMLFQTGSLFNDTKSLVIANIKDVAKFLVPSGGNSGTRYNNLNGIQSCVVLNTGKTDPTCAGSCNGTMTFTIPAGCLTSSNPVYAVWNTGGGCTVVPTGTIIPGTTYTVGGICGCGTQYSVIFTNDEITQDSIYGQFAISIADPVPAKVISFILKQPTCFGKCDGKVICQLNTFGALPITITWTSSNPVAVTTHTINNHTRDTLYNSCAGSYSVVLTDANGCVSTQSVTVLTQPTVVTHTITPSVLLCNGDCNGTVTDAQSGGTAPFTFTWTPIGGVVTTVSPNSTYSSLCSGTYTVKTTDANGCKDSANTTIVAPVIISATKSPLSGSLNIPCNNTCNGVIGVTGVAGGAGGYTYVWTPAGGTVTSTSVTSTYSNLCGSVAGTTYTCTIKDLNNCTITKTFTVTAPPPLSHTITATNPKCNVGATGSATVTESGGVAGYTFTWNPSGVVSGVSPTSINSGIGGGTYTVIIKDANLCADTATVTLTPPAVLTATITTTTNPTCPTLANGQLCVTAGGGTPIYTYTWAPAGGNAFCTPATLTVTAVGTSNYSVTITDINSCTVSVTGIMTSPPQATINSSITQPLCSGVCNGSATLTPTGGIGPFTYVWSCTASTLNNISGQCGATTCNYTVTDVGTNCRFTGSVSFVTVPAITAVQSPLTGSVNVNCNNTCNGSINVNTVAGGTAPYVFTWAPLGGVQVDGATSSTYSGLCGSVAGTTYTCTITDFNNCSITKTFTITTPTPLSNTITATNPLCNVGSTGSATVTASGGVAGYTFVWSPGGGTQSGVSPTSIYSNIGGGTYTVIITDANLCKDTATIILIPPPVLTATITTTTNPTCPTLANGQLCVTPGGGTGANTFTWSPMGGNASCTAATLTVTAGGTLNYTVIVSDANTCTVSVTGTMTSPPQATITPTVVNPPCGGVCNGTATLTPTGGTGPFTYAWSCTGATLDNIGGQCGGTSCNYTVTDVGTNCRYTGTVSFTVAPTLVVNISATALSCSNGCNSIITSTVSGGTPIITYSWTGTGANAVVVAATNQTNMCFGNYTCQVTDGNSCVQTATVAIVAPPPMTITLVPTQPTCYLTCNGSILATLSGGTSPYPGVSWSPSVNPNPPSTLNPTGLCVLATPGQTYTLTITDNNGCKDSNTVTLITPPSLTVTVNTSSVTCTGLCNGTATATVSGGTPGYTYSWDGGVFTNSDDTSGLCVGNHTVSVRDAMGCLAGAQIFAITAPNPIATTVINITNTCGPCSGLATANPSSGTGPYTFTWTPTGGNLVNADSLCIGNYTLTVGDANNCPVATATFAIVPIVNINIAVASQSVSCNNGCDGSATATASSGLAPYNMVWTSSPTYTVSASCPGVVLTCSVGGLCPGTYVIAVTDVNGCINKDSIIIGNPPILTAVGTKTDVQCFGTCTGSATVTPGGGTIPYIITWSDGTSGSPKSNMCPGPYSYTVTDNKGCQVVQTLTITSSAQFTLVPSSTPALACGGLTGSVQVIVSGGTATYTFTWALPGGVVGGVSPTSTYSGISAGVYTVTVGDINGCDTTLQIGLSDPASPTVTATSTSVTCNGTCNGSSTVTAVGVNPVSITWPVGLVSGPSPLIVSLQCAGIYIVQATDGNGCSSFTNDTILGPPPITDSPTTIVQPNCGNGGSITFTPGGGGGGPYTFTWTPGSGGSLGNPNTNVPPGVDTVIIADVNGCTNSFTYTMNPASSLTVTLTKTDNSCSYACTGSATVTTIGGSPAYSYTWTSSAGIFASGIITNVAGLCPGNYTVTTGDLGGCLDVQTFTITAPPIIVPNFSKIDNLCNAGCTGSATVAPTGGTGAYTYNWTPASGVVLTSATNSVDSAMCPNSYTVVITDANSCTDTTTFIIAQPATLTVTVASTDPSCFGICNGSATVTPSGGTGTTYTVSWLPNLNICPSVTVCTVSLLCATIPQYTITTVDSNGCQNIQLLTLNPATQILATATPTDPICFGDTNGSIVSNTTGGTPGYTYQWFPIGGTVTSTTATSTYSNLSASPPTYTLVITDANNCTDTTTYTLSPPVQITMSSSVVDASCGLSNGSITISSVNGNGAVTVLWLAPGPCAGSSSFTCTPLGLGVYSFELTDSRGCKDTFNVAVGNPGGPDIDSTIVNNTCFGVCSGVITATVTSGINVVTPYTFSWTPTGIGVTTTTNSTSYTGLCTSGNPYILIVTDSLGCGTATTFTIGEPTQIQDNGNFTNATCVGINDGTITSVASGGTPGTTGYTYTLDGGVPNTTGIFIGVSAGPHTVCISDSIGCPTCFTYNIGASTAIVSLIDSTNLTCPAICNGSATVSNVNGGNAPYSIVWSDPNSQVGPIAIGLCAGTYTATITDILGCKAFDTITVLGPAPILPNAVTGSPACGVCDGTITLAPTGGTPGTTGYTYNWSTGSTASFIDSVCAGVAQVDIFDSLGCKFTVLFPVSNPGSPTVTATATSPACGGTCVGTATATIVGGGIPPYTYQWSTIPVQTTPTIGSLCPGIYFVQVKDSVGCIATVPDTINPGSILSSNPTFTNPACGAVNGSISTNVTGGSGTYSYSWTPGGAVTSGIGPVPAGSYSVLITDLISGCVDSASVLLNSTNGPILTPTSTDALCNGACTGTASVSIFPVATYTVSWNTGQSTNGIVGLCVSGNPYVVTVIDGLGCIQSTQVNIGEPGVLVTGLPIITQPKCNGDCNGSINTVVFGGTPIYSYTWSPSTVVGPGGDSLCSGNYSVTVTDANGCTVTEFDTLVNPPLLSITGTVTPASCNTTLDAVINTTTSGGIPSLVALGYTWQWSGASTTTTPSLTAVPVGNYTVVVTDSKNCTDTANFVVGAAITVLVTAGNDTVLCSVPSFTLNGTANAGTTVQWIQLPNPPLTVVGNTTTVTVAPISGDTTQYVLIGQNGACFNSDTISVISNSLPVPDAGPTITIFTNQSGTIGGTPTIPGGGTIVWNPTIGVSDTTAANPVVTASVTTTYTVFVTNANGCVGFDTVTVIVLPTFIIPNGFSPNGDGINDGWQIDNILKFPDCEVEVYNRWGEQLFYSRGYTIPWNGKYKGKDVPIGTYYYVIRLNDKEKKFPDHFAGPLTILR